MQNSLSNQPHRLSGAHISVPKLKVSGISTTAKPAGRRRTPEDLEALYDVLYRVDAACGPKAKAPDRVKALIEVCISEGCNVDRDIIGVLAKMGFNPRHVAMVLTKSAGADPARYPWKLVSKRTYELHPDRAV